MADLESKLNDANPEDVQKEFIAIQKEYYDNLLVEMKEDCETYMKATECHEYAKLLIQKMGKFREGFEQYKKNCYEFSAGMSCHNAGNIMLLGEKIKDPDGNVVFERDVPAAAALYKHACTTTYARSCVSIAKLLQFGNFIEKDYAEAFRYLSIGCQKNNNESCFAKANCYIQGMGVEQDYSKAIPILEANCTKGHHGSCHNLGVLYFHGHGVEKDLNKFKLYNEKAQIFRGQKDPFKGKRGKAPPQYRGPEAL